MVNKLGINYYVRWPESLLQNVSEKPSPRLQILRGRVRLYSIVFAYTDYLDVVVSHEHKKTRSKLLCPELPSALWTLYSFIYALLDCWLEFERESNAL